MFYFVIADCPDFVGDGASRLDPVNCTLYYNLEFFSFDSFPVY